MDKKIDPKTRSYNGEHTRSLENAVYLRLTTPRGSYWADNQFGSLLHLIKREKDVARVGLLAQQYAEEALQPIIDDKRAKSITVTPQQPHNGRLILQIDVTDQRDMRYKFNHHVRVI